MYLKRQKILLAYIFLSGGKCSPLHLMKSLFVYCKDYGNNIYDFHPYKRGPFSELMYLDLRKLEEKGIISQSNYIININETGLINEVINGLDGKILYQLVDIVGKFGKFNDKDLMNNIYDRYPYYAINNPDVGNKYKDHDPRYFQEKQNTGIFTIGYEGKTIDAYIDELIRSNIKVLVDIRRNPQSMKYGFSGNRLREIIEKRGIRYISIPELGIEGEDRKSLESKNDYEMLFLTYRKDLPNKQKYINSIIDLLNDSNRIALTCFEADYRCCHRNEVANYLYTYLNNQYELTHI